LLLYAQIITQIVWVVEKSPRLKCGSEGTGCVNAFAFYLFVLELIALCKRIESSAPVHTQTTRSRT